MAGDWIKVEKSTARKPEVLRIADILGIHPDHAFGLCVRFWSWCDDQMESGHAPSVTIVTLNCVFGHAGFVESLIEVGWLRVRGSSLEVPNFDRHLSESAKNRALSSRRKQKQRASETPEMSRSERDNSVTREEKSKKDPPPEDLPPTSPPGGTRKRDASAYTATFERFFDAYPRKAGKVKAFDAWNRACKRTMSERTWTREQTVEFVIGKAAEFAKSPKGQGEFCPYPATWLNQGRFDDDPAEWQRDGADRAVSGSGNGPGTSLAKAQQREADQLGVIHEWLEERGQ